MINYLAKRCALAAAAILSFSLFAGGGWSIAHADNANPALLPPQAGDPPFPQCDDRIFLMRTDTNSAFEITGGQLVVLNLDSPPPSLIMDPIGDPTLGFTYNAMAYNPQDDFLYAIKDVEGRSDNKDLLKIGADGVPRYVATLPELRFKAIVGEFGDDGFFYIGDEQSNLYKYDLSGPTPQMVWDEPYVSPRIFQDFGIYDGFLWAIATSVSTTGTNYRILKFDISGGSMSHEEGPAHFVEGKQLSFTSLFAAKNGIYAYDTAQGNFAKLDMSSNDISQMQLQFLAQGETMTGSDGAKCPLSPLGLPAEISVTKTSPSSTFMPGDTVNYTVSVQNQGPWGAAGIMFDDPLPAGATDASWTCTPSSPEATCTPASGTGSISAMIDLTAMDTSVTFDITMLTDPAAGADLVNTATVTVPEDFRDDPSNNTSTSTILLPAPDFSIQKDGVFATQGDTASAGDIIDYSVTVSNTSSVVLSEVTVTDDGPQFGGVGGTGTLSSFEPAQATLPPGGEAIFTATYVISEQDLANLAHSGSTEVVNVATVSATGPSGTAQTKEATSTLSLDAPAIHLEKSALLIDLVGPVGASGEAVPDAGDRIEYTLTVTNTGTVALNEIDLVDPFVSDLTLVNTELDDAGYLLPGKTITYTASHTITKDDVERGHVHNIATVTASYPGDPAHPGLEHSAEHIEDVSAYSKIVVDKFASLDPFDTDGLLVAGEDIHYTVRLTNEGNVTLNEARPVDAGPTFGGHQGTGRLSDFTPESVVLAQGETADFIATYTLSEADMSNAVGVDAVRNVATATAIRADGIDQLEVISGEALLTLPAITIEKSTEFPQVVRGGIVPFLITLKPSGLQRATFLDLVDTMPLGFTYVPGSARINNKLSEPSVSGRRLVFPLELKPGEAVELHLQLAVSAAVEPGIFHNFAHAELSDSGLPYGERASAQVEVSAEPVFDCGDLLGRVFADRNHNGHMDEHEDGVPGVRLVAVEGTTITTDEDGRFHLTCADLPQHRLGSTFLLKLDPVSLPAGYRILSENPRAVRLSAGKVTRINFATSVSRVVRVDINSDAFVADTLQLRPEWEPRLGQLVSLLRREPSVLRLSYIDQNSDRRLAAHRVEFLRDIIRHLWERNPGNYRLEIESRILTQLGQGWEEPNSISWVIEH